MPSRVLTDYVSMTLINAVKRISLFEKGERDKLDVRDSSRFDGQSSKAEGQKTQNSRLRTQNSRSSRKSRPNNEMRFTTHGAAALPG